MKIGDTVTFTYFGGSNYGGARKVKITEETARTWGGIDLKSNEYKKYMKSKMKNILINNEQTLEQSKKMLESILHSNVYSKSVESALITEFNNKWKVNYFYSADKGLVEQPKVLTKNITVQLSKDTSSGVISFDVHGISIELNNSGGFYVNGHFRGTTWNAYRKLDTF